MGGVGGQVRWPGCPAVQYSEVVRERRGGRQRKRKREAGKERGSERGAEIPSSSWLSPCQYSRFFGGLCGTAGRNDHQKTARLVVKQIFPAARPFSASLRVSFTALKVHGGAKLKPAAFIAA